MCHINIVSQMTTEWAILRLCLGHMWPAGHYLSEVPVLMPRKVILLSGLVRVGGLCLVPVSVFSCRVLFASLTSQQKWFVGLSHHTGINYSHD